MDDGTHEQSGESDGSAIDRHWTHQSRLLLKNKFCNIQSVASTFFARSRVAVYNSTCPTTISSLWRF